jgi:hypothetical protein
MPGVRFEPGLPFSVPPVYDYDGNGSSATFDNQHLYRYELGRWWGPSSKEGKRAVFVMLNPSQANGRKDDATIRRCRGFAKSWNLQGLHVVNLFAYIATHPTDLRKASDPVGNDNHIYLRWAFEDVRDKGGPLVFAWGAITDDLALERAAEVTMMAQRLGVQPMCLGKTKNGMPCHPLRLSKDTQLEEWP